MEPRLKLLSYTERADRTVCGLQYIVPHSLSLAARVILHSRADCKYLKRADETFIGHRCPLISLAAT